MNRTTASGVVHGTPWEQRELYPSRGAGRTEEFTSSLSAGEFSCRVIEGEW